MSKRQEMRENRQRQQKTQRRIAILVGIAVIVFAVALAVFLSNQPSAPQPVSAINSPKSPVTRPQVNFNSMGDPNAPVKIVEYSDFQCPYCARFVEETEGKIVESYVKTGKVYFTSRSFGNWVSGNINQQVGTDNRESEDAAMASYCAGDQNKFWEYRDILFGNQNGENEGGFVRARLDAFAEKLGLDLNAFKTCMDTNKYAAQVTKDGEDGVKDITSSPGYDKSSGYGTPAFIINGKLLDGAQPFDVFQKEIDAALAAAGK
jgi:protein-disulfide isomerase